MAKKKGTEPVIEYNRIKKVLTEKGISQAELADLMELRYVTVTNYVNNKRQPGIETFFQIAKILKVKVRDLINE